MSSIQQMLLTSQQKYYGISSIWSMARNPSNISPGTFSNSIGDLVLGFSCSDDNSYAYLSPGTLADYQTGFSGTSGYAWCYHTATSANRLYSLIGGDGTGSAIYAVVPGALSVTGRGLATVSNSVTASGCAIGSLLLGYFGAQDSIATLSAPSGWTLIARGATGDASNGSTNILCAKICDSSSPSFGTFAMSYPLVALILEVTY